MKLSDDLLIKLISSVSEEKTSLNVFQTKNIQIFPIIEFESNHAYFAFGENVGTLYTGFVLQNKQVIRNRKKIDVLDILVSEYRPDEFKSLLSKNLDLLSFIKSGRNNSRVVKLNKKVYTPVKVTSFDDELNLLLPEANFVFSKLMPNWMDVERNISRIISLTQYEEFKFMYKMYNHLYHMESEVIIKVNGTDDAGKLRIWKQHEEDHKYEGNYFFND